MWFLQFKSIPRDVSHQARLRRATLHLSSTASPRALISSRWESPERQLCPRQEDFSPSTPMQWECPMPSFPTETLNPTAARHSQPPSAPGPRSLGRCFQPSTSSRHRLTQQWQWEPTPFITACGVSQPRRHMRQEQRGWGCWQQSRRGAAEPPGGEDGGGKCRCRRLGEGHS